jgi:hypothetical protein
MTMADDGQYADPEGPGPEDADLLDDDYPLTTCPECGSGIYDDYAKCPECGAWTGISKDEGDSEESAFWDLWLVVGLAVGFIAFMIWMLI